MTAQHSAQHSPQYDTIGDAYDFVAGLDVYHRVFWGVRVRDYRAFADAAVTACGDGTLLDAGCGSMLFTLDAYRSQQRVAVFGCDLSMRMLRIAHARLEERSRRRSAVLLQANVFSSPFRSKSFDVVLCMHIAHVIDDLSGLIAESSRLLKPGGRLFLTSLVLVDSWRDGYLRMLSRRGIMAGPRRSAEIVTLLREGCGSEPEAHQRGSMFFAQAMKT